MLALEWLVILGIAIVFGFWRYTNSRHARRMLQLYFAIDELLLPFYQESLRRNLKDKNYAAAQHDLNKTLSAYKIQIRISKKRYFHKFIEHSNAFDQTFQQDLLKHGLDLESKLLQQKDLCIALIKHLTLWLMDLEKRGYIDIPSNLKWKAEAPAEAEWGSLVRSRPEQRMLFIRMQLLYIQCMQVLWCWHFSLIQSHECIKAAQFLTAVLNGNYACTRILGLKQLLPQHDTDYAALVEYCSKNPIDLESICSGQDRSLDSSWSDFDASIMWNEEESLMGKIKSRSDKIVTVSAEHNYAVSNPSKILGIKHKIKRTAIKNKSDTKNLFKKHEHAGKFMFEVDERNAFNAFLVKPKQTEELFFDPITLLANVTETQGQINERMLESIRQREQQALGINSNLESKANALLNSNKVTNNATPSESRLTVVDYSEQSVLS